MSALESLDPWDAMEMFLDRQKSDHSDASVQSYRYRIRGFIEWMEENGITDLNHLSGRDIVQFDSERRAEVTTSTVNNQLGTIRLFLRFCESIEGVEEGLAEKVEPPSLRKVTRSNSEKLEPARARQILDRLDRFAYATFEHTLFALAWHTGMRLGSLYALDVEDCYLEEDDIGRLPARVDVEEETLETLEPPFLFVHHDPETPLKNKQDGERAVALLPQFAEILESYLNVHREECEEDGRHPLFTTVRGGRASKSTLRRRIYEITQPCRLAECPHGRSPTECVAREHGKESRCPSAMKPHAIRTGMITHFLDRGWSHTDLGARVNATPEVIEVHYDWPDKVRRMQNRRSLLDSVDDGGSP